MPAAWIRQIRLPVQADVGILSIVRHRGRCGVRRRRVRKCLHQRFVHQYAACPCLTRFARAAPRDRLAPRIDGAVRPQATGQVVIELAVHVVLAVGGLVVFFASTNLAVRSSGCSCPRLDPWASARLHAHVLALRDERTALGQRSADVLRVSLLSRAVGHVLVEQARCRPPGTERHRRGRRRGLHALAGADRS